MNKAIRILASTGAAEVCIAVALAQPTLTNLGVLPGAQTSSASGVNADGTVVVGACGFPTFSRAWRWADGQMLDLGTLPGWESSKATGVSADGTVVVGSVSGPAGASLAIRWTAGGGMTSIGTLQGREWSVAQGVSADGSVIVGTSGFISGRHHAFRWSSGGGMQDLGTLPQGTGSRAYGVSADGTVVVGFSHVDGVGDRAFRWTAEDGMENLGVLSGSESVAYAASRDGSVVVGYSGTLPSNYWHAFRWTRGGGMEDLGLFPEVNQTTASGVSGDGFLIVGTGLRYPTYRALLWTRSLGAVDLNSHLPLQGVPLSGWVLREAAAISADGSAVAGYGTFNGAYRAWLLRDLPARCYPDCDSSTGRGILDIFDFLCFQNRYDAGDPYACDCDISSGPGACDIFDFLCFQNAYAAGCR